MSFIESYKHLDKICGEMFETQYGVSAYIEEMLNNPRGSFLVRGWENDLKQLKHYRWIRNQIVHEPDCYEQNMCESGDDEWLDDFYERIINQTDPLTLYAKATAPKPTKKTDANTKDRPRNIRIFSASNQSKKVIENSNKSYHCFSSNYACCCRNIYNFKIILISEVQYGT